MSPPITTKDLLPSELAFLPAMQRLRFGRFEYLRIENGELVLDPWPTTVQAVKFGSENTVTSGTPTDDFQLKRQVIELFEYVREVSAGEIRTLEIRHGLPFSMEVELSGTQSAAREEGHRG